MAQTHQRTWSIRSARLSDGIVASLIGFETPEKVGVQIRKNSTVVDTHSFDRNGHKWNEVVNTAVEEAQFEKFISQTTNHNNVSEDPMKEKIAALQQMITHLGQVKERLVSAVTSYKAIPVAAVVAADGVQPQQLVGEAIQDFETINKDIDQVVSEAQNQIAHLNVARPSERVASGLKSLASKALQIIQEANKAEAHWKKAIVLNKDVQAAETLKDAPQHVQETYKQASGINKLFGLFGLSLVPTKTATYIPPSGAGDSAIDKDTGDKWPVSGDSAGKELDAWRKQNSEFNTTKNKEDQNVNAADSPRLVGQASVTLIRDKNPRNSRWVVTNVKTGSKVIFTFADVCNTPKDMTQANYDRFVSDEYKSRLLKEAKTYGLGFIKQSTKGKSVTIVKQGAGDGFPPVVKDESEKGGADKNLHADELPMGGGGEEGGEEKGGKTETVEVKPVEKAVKQIEKAVDTIMDEVGLGGPSGPEGDESAHENEFDKGEQMVGQEEHGGGEMGGAPKEKEPFPSFLGAVQRQKAMQVVAAEGTEGLLAYYTKMFGDAGYAQKLVRNYEGTKGTPSRDASLTSQAAVTQRATNAVQLARLQASRGLIPFTRESIREAALAASKLDSTGYQFNWNMVEMLPVVAMEALGGDFPELHNMERGVVGDHLESVRQPATTVTTQGEISNGVKGDGKIETGPIAPALRSARQGTRLDFVPQMQIDGRADAVALPFTTTESKLAAKGVDARQFLKRHDYGR